MARLLRRRWSSCRWAHKWRTGNDRLLPSVRRRTYGSLPAFNHRRTHKDVLQSFRQSLRQFAPSIETLCRCPFMHMRIPSTLFVSESFFVVTHTHTHTHKHTRARAQMNADQPMRGCTVSRHAMNVNGCVIPIMGRGGRGVLGHFSSNPIQNTVTACT